MLGGVTLAAGDYVTATATKIDDSAQVGVNDSLPMATRRSFRSTVRSRLHHQPAPSLWINTENDVTSGGTTDVDSWTGGTILKFGDPNSEASIPRHSGTFSTVFTIDTLVDDGDARLSGLHYVGRDIQVGTNNVQLYQGDVLFSTVNDGGINGGAEQIWAHDVLLYPTRYGRRLFVRNVVVASGRVG